MIERIFNNLHLHSEYSTRDAISKIKDIVAKAKEQGSTACALTDHGVMYGCLEFYKECKKQGINPILGCEMYVIEHKELANDPNHKHDKFHIIFLAKDSIGYHQIADCVSRGQLLKDKKTYPRTTHEDIKEIFVGGHVICLSGCVNGEMAYYLSNNNFDKAKETATFYKEVFGDDYYFELQDHSLLIEMEYFDKLIELGKEMNIPLVATNDSHYINKSDKHTREMVVAMRFSKKLDEIEPDCGELYMKGFDEMYQLFGQWPETIENTVKISNQCHIDGILVEGVVNQSFNETTNEISYIITDIPETLTFDIVKRDVDNLLLENDIKEYSFIDNTVNNNSFSQYILTFNSTQLDGNIETITKHLNEELGKIVHIKHFPKFKVPDGFKDEKEYIYYLTYKNFPIKYPPEKYSKEELESIKNRIEYELGVICDLHYDGYLLIVQDFINAGRKLGMIGPGRGSAVGSVVCYNLGITNVDPLPYNLIFERFLNKDRVSDPDIDTDFAPMIRDAVIDYVKEIYGENSVCQIITFGTLGARASIRNAGRVHGLPIPFCDKISKMIPSTPGITLQDAIEGNEKKEIAPVVDLVKSIKKDKDVAFLIEEAKKIEGLTVQTGVHAAGVIIADKDVSSYCPMCYDVDKNVWITQYEKNSCEHDVGLLKMDFLGLENLNIIYRTLQDIETNYGIKLDIDDIRLDNKEEMAIVLKNIFEKGKTKGVFQFESSGMVNYLKKIKPSKLEDLILLNAAYRPGPMQYLDEIIAIRNGIKNESYICEDMRDILHVTFSKPIYQEQIQQIFHNIAGFTLGEADIIRRAMSKKKLKELEKYFPLFKSRLLEKGVAQEDIDKFCDELIDFAKYAFNKSHATAYTVVAYQTAWLKHFYPVEYMANLLTSSTTKSMPVYINECKNMGIEVLPPDINTSGVNFTPLKDGSIRFGLKIKSSGTTSNDIIEERNKNGQFLNIMDFVDRMINIGSRATHSNVLSAYIMAGAFDSFGYNRKQLYDSMTKYVTIVKTINKAQKEKNDLLKELKSNNDIISTFENQFGDFVIEKDIKLIKKFARAIEKYKKSLDKEDETLINQEMQTQMKTIFNDDFINKFNLNITDLSQTFLNVGNAYILAERLPKTISNRDEKINDCKKEIDVCIDKNTLEYDRNFLLEREKEILGFYVSGHPLDSYKGLIERTASDLIGDIDISLLKEQVVLVGKIKDFTKLYTKKDNKEMCAFTLEDLTGEIKVICFSNKYFDLKDILVEGQVIKASGTIQDNSDGVVNDAGEIDFIPQLYLSTAEIITLNTRIYIEVKDLIEWNEIKPIINKQCRGEHTLYVYFKDTKKLQQYTLGVTDAEIIKMKLPNINIVER